MMGGQRTWGTMRSEEAGSGVSRHGCVSLSVSLALWNCTSLQDGDNGDPWLGVAWSEREREMAHNTGYRTELLPGAAPIKGLAPTLLAPSRLVTIPGGPGSRQPPPG